MPSNMDDHERRLNQEIDQLVLDIRRIGPTYPSPQPRVLFGELFDDERVEQYYEALVGTLKSAKKRGIVNFKGQILFKGVHDRVVISIVDESPPPPKKIGEDGRALEPTKKGGVGGSIATGTTAPLASAPRKPLGLSDRDRRKTVGATPSVDRAGGGGGGGKPSSKLPSTKPAGTGAPRKWTSTRTLGPSSRTAVPLVVGAGVKGASKKMHGAAAAVVTPPADGGPRRSSLDDNGGDDDRSVSTAATVATAPAQLQPAVAKRPSPARPLVRRTSSALCEQANERVAEEISRLPLDIARIRPEGKPYCLFGDLFDDDDVQQHYEALVGTLKSAKRRGVVKFKGQMLLKGMHDRVRIDIVDGSTPPPPKKIGEDGAALETSESTEDGGGGGAPLAPPKKGGGGGGAKEGGDLPVDKEAGSSSPGAVVSGEVTHEV